MADPYALPELIVARLDLSATILWPVMHFADLANLREGAQVAPAVIVIPYGMAIADDGDATSVQETALVSTMVRSVNQKSAQQARQQSGPMLTAIAALLTGWQPTSAYLPLTIETPPQPVIEAGFVTYFLQYVTNYSLE